MLVLYTAEEADGYLTERLTPFLTRLPDGAWRRPMSRARSGVSAVGVVACGRGGDRPGGHHGEYRAWFADRRRGLAELFPPEADTEGYGRTVATTWDLAEAADRLEPAGSARAMVQLVAVLDQAGVPEGVLTGPVSRAWLTMQNPAGEVTSASARRALRSLGPAFPDRP